MKKQFLILVSLLTLAGSGFAQLPGFVSKDGIIGYWPFTGNTKDVSGNGNDFTNNGATLIKDRNGVTDAAYEFDGSSTYMICNSLTHAFGDTGNFSISVWLQKTNTNAGVALMSGTATSNYFIWLIQGGSSDMMFGTNKQSSSWFYAPTGYSVNSWDHYVGVFRSDSMFFYKNGVKSATNFFNYTKMLQDVFPLYVGRGVSGNYYTGYIDDIGLWRRALTQGEIDVLYKGKCDGLVKSDPVSQKLRIGGTARFTTIADATTYQWQRKNGSSYVNVTNGGQYSGATTKTLNISALTKTNSGMEFRCIVTSGPCADTSQNAVLTLCGNITRQPKSVNSTISNNATFIISSNDPSPSYQWQINTGSGFQSFGDGGQFKGATNDTLVILNLTKSNNQNKFRCVVTQSSCVDTTSIATLGVCGEINLHPKDQTVLSNQSAQFIAGSTDPSAGYQWQTNTGSGFQNLSNSGQISGATVSKLQISNVKLTNNGQLFRSIITHGACVDTTNAAKLGVCGFITKQPQHQTVRVSQSLKLVVASSEANATYQWQTDPGSGFQDLFNVGPYSGVNSDTFKVASSFVLNNNQKFRCIVNHGACTDTSTVAVVTICGEINLQPQSKTLNSGLNAQFEVGSNDANALFQWQTNTGSGFQNVIDGGQYSGATSKILLVSNVSLSNNNHQFRCLVTQGVCTDTSNTAGLTICGDITQQPVKQDVKAGQTAQFSVKTNYTTPVYQWQGNQGGSFSNLINNSQYSGVNTDVLKVSNTTVSMDKTNYRCIVSEGVCGDTSVNGLLLVSAQIGINTQKFNPLFSVFPNPSHGIITIEAATGLMGSDYYLYNTVGTLVLSGKIKSETTRLDIGQLAKGIYMLRVGGENQPGIKVIKE